MLGKFIPIFRDFFLKKKIFIFSEYKKETLLLSNEAIRICIFIA